MRKNLAQEKDAFSAWEEIDNHVGMPQNEDLRSVLISLRTRFEHAILQKALRHIRAAFSTNSTLGWNLFLGVYGAALSRWRPTFCFFLIHADLPVPSINREVFTNIQLWTRYVSYEQWSKLYDLFIFMAEQAPGDAAQHAKLFVTAAEIQLIIFSKPERAHGLLERAEELAPQDVDVLAGRARYWLNQSDQKLKDKALERYQQVTKAFPHKATPFSGMGEYYVQAHDLTKAEEYYQQAIQVQYGNSAGYFGLVRLYGEPNLFRERKERIPGLVKLITVVDPPSEYSARLNAGYAFQLNNEYKEALKWFDSAIHLDENRTDGYIYKGNFYLQQSKYKIAERYYRKAIQADPELYEGYFDLGWLFQYQEKWAESVKYFQECISRQPEMEDTFRLQIGEMYVKLQDVNSAAREFIDILKRVPENTSALTQLENLVKTSPSQSFSPQQYHLLGAALRDLAKDYQREPNLSQRFLVLCRTLAQTHFLKISRPIAANRNQSLESLIPVTTPIILEADNALFPLGADTPEVIRMIADKTGDIAVMRDRIQQKTGVHIPGVRLRGNYGLSDGRFNLLIDEIPILSGSVVIGNRYCSDVAGCHEHGIEGQLTPGPDDIETGLWLASDTWQKAEEAGLSLQDAYQYMLSKLEFLIMQNLGKFLGVEETNLLLEKWSGQEEGRINLRKRALPDEAAQVRLTSALQRLVEEGVAVLDLEVILSTFSEANPRLTEITDVVEELRLSLCQNLPDRERTRGFVYTPPELEAALLHCVQEREGRRFLVIPILEAEKLRGDFRSVLGNAPAERQVLVVANPGLRPFVWRLLNNLYPTLIVLAEREINHEQ